MNSLAPNLPEDTHSLHEIIKSQHAVIEALRAQIAALKRARFGRSSEKLDRQIEQLELVLDEMAYQAPDVDISCESSDTTALKNRPARQRLPEDLPREEVMHEPDLCCPECGDETYSKIGEDISEVLNYVPAHFKALRHVRPKYSCRACETIRQSDLPSMPITKGKAGAGLLAHIIVSKYCDHLPLYRQSEIFARQGIHPQEHLQNYAGILQADGYAGYNAITAKNNVTEAACWAHVRRKFYEDYEITRIRNQRMPKSFSIISARFTRLSKRSRASHLISGQPSGKQKHCRS